MARIINNDIPPEAQQLYFRIFGKSKSFPTIGAYKICTNPATRYEWMFEKGTREKEYIERILDWMADVHLGYATSPMRSLWKWNLRREIKARNFRADLWEELTPSYIGVNVAIPSGNRAMLFNDQRPGCPELSSIWAEYQGINSQHEYEETDDTDSAPYPGWRIAEVEQNIITDIYCASQVSVFSLITDPTASNRPYFVTWDMFLTLESDVEGVSTWYNNTVRGRLFSSPEAAQNTNELGATRWKQRETRIPPPAPGPAGFADSFLDIGHSPLPMLIHGEHQMGARDLAVINTPIPPHGRYVGCNRSARARAFFDVKIYQGKTG